MTCQPRSLVRKFGTLLFVSSFAAASLLATNYGQNSATKQFQKTLTLGEGQTLSMDHKFGDVRIHGEGGRDVKISATIRVQANSQGEADKYAEQVRIDVTQDSQGVKIHTVYPDDSAFFKIRIHGPSYSVDYDIAVPVDAKLYVRDSFGNTEVSGVRGWADVENGHGRLVLRDGGSAKLANSFGSVEATGADGNVAIVNNNGAVTASSIKGALDIKDRFASVTVSTIQGAVTVSDGNGAVDVSDAGATKINNSFGSVNARNIHGDLAVNNSNGAIDVNTVSGGAQLNTTFGSINFTNVSGSVRCTSSNGRVRGGPSGGEVFVKTSFGEVLLEQINGPVEVEDSNGGINVKDIKGKGTFTTSFGAIDASGLPKGVRAITGNGRITLSDVGAEAYAKTSFGAVDLRRVNGNVIIENSNGPVAARNVSGDASARTSFGSVTLEDVSGVVNVDNQNGAIAVTAARGSQGCKSITLKTSFSSMQVRLPADANYDVSARTSFGHITSEMPVTSTGVLGGDSLNGKIGNGGCTLSLTNSNGNIEILKQSK